MLFCGIRTITRIFLLFCAFFGTFAPLCYSMDNGLRTENPFNSLRGYPSLLKRRTKFVVLVHGTVAPIPSWSTLKKWLGGSRDGYSGYLEHARFDAIQKHQPIGELGLHQVVDGEKSPAGTFVTCYQKYKNPLACYRFYTYGWDGRLDSSSWLTAAVRCYRALFWEVFRQGLSFVDVDVEFYAHSHGGNVVLNLAQAEILFKCGLIISKIVLLGTPIQQSTEALAKSPLFEHTKIYNVYSEGDVTQILDQGVSFGGISGRRFTDPVLCDKISQICVTCEGRSLTHSELWLSADCSSGWLSYVPFITPIFLYRRDLAIYPHPVLSFIPKILSLLREDSCHNYALDLRRCGAGAAEQASPADVVSQVECCIEPIE